MKKWNGKRKEYYKGHLKFEGEYLYLNGKRNGEGKEYNADNLIFEEEYLFGNKGKGKSYINGILEYEGEYLHDNKYNGKGFDEKSNIIYELKNGNRKVKEYDYNRRLIFQGEFSYTIFLKNIFF